LNNFQLINSPSRGNVSPYLRCLSLSLLSLYTLFQFLRDSSKDCRNTGFHNCTHIDSSHPSTYLTSNSKNIIPLDNNPHPNYWNRQPKLFKHNLGKFRKIQFYNITTSQQEISLQTSLEFFFCRQKIQYTFLETQSQLGRIIKTPEFQKFTNTGFRHFPHIDSSHLSPLLSPNFRKPKPLDYIYPKYWKHHSIIFNFIHDEIHKFQFHKITNSSPTLITSLYLTSPHLTSLFIRR
jgi:hypothetical protein